jgi:hypothetical protein
MFVFFTSCGGQNKTDLPKEKIKSETKDIVTSPGSNEKYHTKYEYTDSIGASLIIQNSFPKSGINYTDPNGKKYIYAVFWTEIINETVNPLEVTIDFPLDSFEIPSSSGNYMKLLLPSDTMTIDKEPLYDYGLTIKSFLDNNRDKSSCKTYQLPVIFSVPEALGINDEHGSCLLGFTILFRPLFFQDIPIEKINQ